MSEMPPWVDKEKLAWAICVCVNTVDAWVADGTLPPPRKRGAKLMWKWSEVDECLTVGKVGNSTDDKAERIRNATRAAASAPRH